MHETPEELDRLQQLMDASYAAAGPHLRNVITEEHRPSAAELCDLLQGMRLLVVATATADGVPITGPVDGYFLHGSFFFSSSRTSLKMQHLSLRPAVSATHLPSEDLAISVHGRAEVFNVLDPARNELWRAMLDHYLPRQGLSFQEWLEAEDALGARIEATRLFAFRTPDGVWAR